MSGYGKSTAAGLSTQIGEHWSHRSACSKRNPEWWFPVSERGAAAEIATARAKYICATCPVRPQCAETELLARTASPGIVGGFTEAERRDLRKDQWRKGDGLPPVVHPRCERGHMAVHNLSSKRGVRSCAGCVREDEALSWFADNREGMDAVAAELAGVSS